MYVLSSHYSRPPSLPVVTQIGGHIAGPPPPSPLLPYAPSFLSREEVRIFFPGRFASNCTYLYTRTLLGALSSRSIFFFIFANNVKSHHDENRTQKPTLLVLVFEGNQETPGATGDCKLYTGIYLVYYYKNLKYTAAFSSAVRSKYI